MTAGYLRTSLPTAAPGAIAAARISPPVKVHSVTIPRPADCIYTHPLHELLSLSTTHTPVTSVVVCIPDPYWDGQISRLVGEGAREYHSDSLKTFLDLVSSVFSADKRDAMVSLQSS